jgi:hypothetical protein
LVTSRVLKSQAGPSCADNHSLRITRILHLSGHTRISTAIAHLRQVLGDQTYESLARKGEKMTTAPMATYAYDQIDQARAELNAVSK